MYYIVTIFLIIHYVFTYDHIKVKIDEVKQATQNLNTAVIIIRQHFAKIKQMCLQRRLY